jgi:hypothetical protein
MKMAADKRAGLIYTGCLRRDVFLLRGAVMANDDYDEVDETEDPVDNDEDDDEVAAEDAEPAAAAEGSSGGGGGEAAAARTDVDTAESLTVSSKEALRRQLEEEMERFLAKGGRVQEIPPDVTADPPQKPVSNYGSKPI